jgi:hypothetical protein
MHGELVPDCASGTRLIQFSPTADMKIVDEVITRNAPACRGVIRPGALISAGLALQPS